MDSKQEEQASASRKPPASKPLLVWTTFVDGLAVLGTALIGVLMIVICADIVARNTMGASLPLVSELGALLLVMIVCLQLPTTIRADRLARTEVFFVVFRQGRPRAGAALSSVFNLVGAAVLGTIAWASWSILQKDYGSAEFIGVPGIATLPTWPFRALIFVGITVASIQFIVGAVSEFLLSVKGRVEQ